MLTPMSVTAGAAAEFTPILSAYVVSGFEKNQILTSQIQDNLNWHKDIGDSRTPTNWLLTEDPNGFHLVEDPQVED
ncbi:hypothetical protein H0H87_006887 [Tephrocybe sp. NHM501043]|nr:hypothetical protein H0H87_006887 [Tephrocybe sp. NHM501043]